MLPKIALVVPVGPSPVEVHRLADLLESAFRFTAELTCCVLIEDAMPARALDACVPSGVSANVKILKSPREGQGLAKKGGLCAAVLAALDWIHETQDSDFILKIDTDALIISEWVDRVAECARAHPDAAIFGVIGDTSNRNSPLYRGCSYRPSVFSLAAKMIEEINLENASADGEVEFDCGKYGRHSFRKGALLSFRSFLPLVHDAFNNGYRNADYAQGGACVLTKEFVDRLARRNLFQNPVAWIDLPFADDELISLLARSVGLHIFDDSDEGGLFALQHKGLPFAPDEMLVRGHALIHSVKNDCRMPEPQIRQFFASRRSRPTAVGL